MFAGRWGVGRLGGEGVVRRVLSMRTAAGFMKVTLDRAESTPGTHVPATHTHTHTHTPTHTLTHTHTHTHTHPHTP